MRYTKGMRLRNPGAPEWGLGLVLEDTDGRNVRAFFEGVGERTISLQHITPSVAVGPDAESAVLDNLKIEKGVVGVGYKSLPSCIATFLQEFPGGFLGDRFREHERDYKDEIHLRAVEWLGLEPLRELLDRGDHEEVCRRAVKLTGVRSNAMIFANEKMAFRDGLKSPEGAKLFAETLFQVLHGAGSFDQRFERFVDCLSASGAEKWTIATYFLFFVHPDRHMFVKPTITRNAADVCAFDINYRPEVNAGTYRSVLAFSEHLKTAIAELGPKDMIDVQSFMWCIAPGSYRS